MTVTSGEKGETMDREDTRIGGITWHSSEEDGGPDVGISVYLGKDDRLWAGEISRRTFEEWEGDINFTSDDGKFLVRYTGNDVQIIAKFGELDYHLREFMEQIAAWVHAAAPSAGSLIAPSGETIQILLDLLNPLHGELDRQTYDERLCEDFDAPKDAEYSVNITAQMERDLTQAVLILEDRKRAGSVIANQENLLRSQPEPALPDDKAVAWRWREKGNPTWAFASEWAPLSPEFEFEPLYTRPDNSALEGALESALASYERTIAAANRDDALSEAGRARVIEACHDAQGALRAFMPRIRAALSHRSGT